MERNNIINNNNNNNNNNNLLMYMNNIKHCQKWKKKWNPKTDCGNIQSWWKDGIWHRKKCHANNEQRKTTNDGRNRTTKSWPIQNARRKGNLQLLKYIRGRHYQTRRNERKKKLKVSEEKEKITINQFILEVDEERASTNGAEKKKTNDEP